MHRYINFAHDDEALEVIYGERLSALRDLKRRWEPEGRFNQWFPHRPGRIKLRAGCALKL